MGADASPELNTPLCRLSTVICIVNAKVPDQLLRYGNVIIRKKNKFPEILKTSKKGLFRCIGVRDPSGPLALHAPLAQNGSEWSITAGCVNRGVLSSRITMAACIEP